MLHGRQLPLGCFIHVYMVAFIFQIGFTFSLLSLLELLIFVEKKYGRQCCMAATYPLVALYMCIWLVSSSRSFLLVFISFFVINIFYEEFYYILYIQGAVDLGLVVVSKFILKIFHILLRRRDPLL